MKLVVDKKTFEEFPGVKLGVVIGLGVDNTGVKPNISALLKEWTNKRKVEFSNVAIPEHERIKPWREAYSKFGSKPSKYNSSIESLLKRATSGNDLPNINSVVDLYNAMSLKHLMPFGAEDLDKVKGDVQLTFAEGSEPGKYIGGKDIVTCDKGEVAYLDELGFICRRWNWRESDRTKLTDGTKNFILVIEALPPVKGSELEEAVVDFVSQAKENIGGEYSSSILTKDNPVFENGFKTGQKLTEEDIEKLKKIDDSIDRKKEILDKGAAEKGIKKEYVGIANNIYQAIKRVINVDEIHLETPEREEYGDYSSNVAMQLFSKSEIRSTKYETNSKSKISNSKQGTNKSIAAGHNSPRELAEKIAEQLRRDKELQKIVERIEVAGPGFINFHLTRSVLVKELENILSTGDKYGKTHTLKNKKIMVEFAHPNTHKAFHIGHLRNIALGESICRILEFSGYEIIRANYQGDVGMHIAKALWGIKKLSFKDPGGVKTRVEFLGKAYTAGATAYEDDEKAKEEIHKINKEIYSQEDEEINKLYNETRKWSLDYFESIYERVYTKFDRLYFESECYESGKKYTYEALEKGILKRSEGAIIFPGSEYGLHDRVFVTKEDVPTYEAKDFGLIKLQMKEYDPDLVMHVLGPEQLAYTSVIFKAQELLFPETKDKQLHVPYGWVRLKKGKMSSRTGRVVLGEQLLDDAKKEIKKQFKSGDVTAEQIAIGAVKYSFLKVGREQEIAFDLKESVSLEGNSGPYIQYTFARTRSVLRKGNREQGIEKSVNYDNLDLNKEELALLHTYIKFSETIATASENYAPNLICNYLYDLAQKFNTFYQKHPILKSNLEARNPKHETNKNVQNSNVKKVSDLENSNLDIVSNLDISTSDLSKLRLALTFATGQILRSGLNLLGIQAPERM